jgi:uncharacterized membrane protein
VAVSSSTGDALSLNPPAARLWEVDALRGVAIVLMVYFHFMWDLFFFGIYQTNMLAGPWQWFARSIGSTFLFVLGLSATLTHARLTQRMSRPFLWYLTRGLRIFGFGLLITIVTYFFMPGGFVIFGILHLLGVALMLIYPFLSAPRWLTLIIAIAIILIGFQLNVRTVDVPWLLPLGLPPSGVYMSDYYPLMPWFGVALLGVVAGRTWYDGGRRAFDLPDLSSNALVRGLRFLGRHSLLIYLIHQPILIGLLIALGYGSL